ncbi:MAG TPA: MBL fold metallo-hydrolase [Candidatus Angelobacter sp.]|nr:MBL fold metallo-hydrolase [Candidatus Angelobacter sp.]
MNNEPLYLRPNVQIEPLVDQWYAWTHLIPPATAARNITDRHLKIMDSYIGAPQVHAKAVKNPKMLGGPFIDYGGERVDDIKALRDRTKTDRAHLIELSAALCELDANLRNNARGFSLQPLYPTVPAPLQGYVELVYDLNSHPSFRLIEPLLYKSRYYDRSAQSLMLSLIRGDNRPFVLSTPRLEDECSLHQRVPFDHEAVDRLFRMEAEPQPWTAIKDLSGFPDEKDKLLRSFFTTEKPAPYKSYTGNGARWRYFGHACILIETAGMKLLFDPVISYSYETDLPRYTYRDLPDDIDYVLITHNHQDHVLFETLLQIRHKVKNIIVPKNGGGALQDPSVKLILRNAGFKNVFELEELETIQTETGSITGIPFFGEHADLNIQSKLAYLVKVGRHKLLFAADSCNIAPMLYKHVYDEVGSVDALFLGMECDGAPLSWLYGPLLTTKIDRGMDESRRLAGSDFGQAIDMVNRFHCKEVYVYAMGQEPWLNHVMSIKYTAESRPIVESNRLIQECQKHGIVAERLFGEKEILLDA